VTPARRASVRLRRVTSEVPAQLLLYGFGPEADFEGQLVGALERIETGGALRIREVLFVQSDVATGALGAVGLRGDGAGGLVAPLLGFRLDPEARRKATEQAFAEGASSVSGDALRELGSALQPGAALAAVLVEHVWARAVDDAVSRTGGVAVGGRFVEATALSELADDLIAAARRCGHGAGGAGLSG
jgi:hypothetical protein